MSNAGMAGIGILAGVALTIASSTARPLARHADQAGSAARAAATAGTEAADWSAEELVRADVEGRLAADLAAVDEFRPGYAFWQHIFTIPDGSVAFGSAVDGRLLAVVDQNGDWTRSALWSDAALASTVADRRPPVRRADRRERLADLLESEAGPVLHNPTRGLFLLPNVPRYGGFLGEWGAIYERFGVPASIGLAQAIVESGLKGTIRSEARAIGFCQWLARNWRQLQRLAPHVIEGENQTTQAPYCAAYLAVLATKYGSFIPALSEHHAGGTNVGRIVISGERLGGLDIREKYFLGSEFSRHLREASPRAYRDVYGTYGPRSYFYSEMVFGNTLNVEQITALVPQEQIHAMRTPRALPLAEIVKVTGLSADEVRRFNPALVKQVPSGATVYLPSYVEAFGPEVSFWHRPSPAAYATLLHDFLRLEATPEQWDDRSFEPVLQDFARRFKETNTEEGAVMSTVLAYTIGEMYSSRRGAILAEYRDSERIQRLFDRAVLARGSVSEVANP
jgi:hypothetical protein